MKTSATRSKQFSDGLKTWVNAHGIKNSTNTRSKKQRQKDMKTASKLATVIEQSYVTMAEFNGALEKHLQVLDKAMVGAYHLVTHAKHFDDLKSMPLIPKSSSWLARKAMSQLGHRHALQGILQVIGNRISAKSLVQDHKIVSNGDHMINKWPVASGRNIVYLDDGIYSGQQLVVFIITLCTFLWKSSASVNHSYLKKAESDDKWKTHLWIVIPYRSQRAQRLLSLFESGAFHDQLIEDIHYLDMLDDLPDLEHVMASGTSIKDIMELAKRVLKIHIVQTASKPGYEVIMEREPIFNKIGISSNGLGQGLMVFEHKVPDQVSFPDALRTGNQLRSGRFNLETPRKPFVPMNDAKPYGIEQPGLFSHVAGGHNMMS